jgi:hypothetical protein
MPRRNHQKPHTPFTPAKACSDKRPYRSEREALNAAELQMLAHPALELSVYKCDQCSNWHLTRRTPKI